MSLHEAASGLANYHQFILWSLVPNEKTGKLDKIPVNQFGKNIDPHDPNNWLTSDEAFAQASATVYQVGFVLTENDPFFCLDVDHCINEGNWSPLALRMFELLPGAALELSVSGDGVHIWGTYSQALPPRRIKNPGLELYTDKRFIALTNNFTQGNIWIDFTPALIPIIDQYFAPRADQDVSAEWTDQPRDEWQGPDSDDELIKIAMGSKSAASVFGDKASFRDLWNGDPNVLSKHYPSDTDDFGRSEADLALCSHLAFYTGCDCERIDRIFRRSKLNREKWEDREEYRQWTILRAIGSVREVFGARRKKETAEVTQKLEETTGDLNTPSKRDGPEFVTIAEQFDYFKGCVYLFGLHRVFIPTGQILDKADFDVLYSGHSFAMDNSGQKVTKSAYEAYTLNAAYSPVGAETLGFRPELVSGAVYQHEGLRLLNSYVPIQTKSQRGDITLFFDFLQRFLPEQEDRTILLYYMAALVQHPGKKFPWCVVIQGVEGNGKSSLATMLEYAVGERFTHFADPRQLDNQFNDWLLNKTFIAIEEVKAKGQWGVMESLKTMITSKRGPITGKGKDQITADYRANFMMFSNYKDAVHKTRNDRRYCVFYTAQQEHSDLTRDGLDQAYFKNFYEWLNGEGTHEGLPSRGLQYIAHYLKNIDIPDIYDPTKLSNRAPKTSCYEEVIDNNVSVVHDEILQAIDNFEIGFRGGWVSSVAVDHVLKRSGVKYPKRMYTDLLKDIGFEKAPGLNQGKATRAIKSAPDGGRRPTLYTNSKLSQNQVYRDTEYADGGMGLTDLYERAQTQT